MPNLSFGVVASAAVPFSPLDLNPVLWLDAADAGTITSSSGSVSQWNDKSGNGYHASQGTAANQPTTGTVTLNGRNVIDFNGTTHYLESTASSVIGKNVTGATIYTVVRYDNLAGGEDNVIRILTSASNSRFQINLTTTAGVVRVAGRTLDSNSLLSAQSTSLGSSGSPGFISHVGVYNIADTDLYQRINDVLNGSNTSYQTATTTSNTNSPGYTVGSAAAGNNGLDGAIAEIIVYNQYHTSTLQSYVYSYLRGKWGV